MQKITKPNKLKKWYNTNCKIAKRNYNYARHRYHDSRSTPDLENVKRTSKLYKKEIKKSIHAYNKQFASRLRSAKSNNPKEYWNIINNTKVGEKYKCNISKEIFLDHFRKLNEKTRIQRPQDDENINIDQLNKDLNNELINCRIDSTEVSRAIKNLKNNKSHGIDLICNEFIKTAKSQLLNSITLLFNIILESGQYPLEWSSGIISPIYKNKGDINNPDNYRGITVLSCLSKVFTLSCILNNRLTDYLDLLSIINESQAGFRKGYSTIDHIFTLRCLLDLFKNSNKKLYCAFVDYKKAFDSINRTSLWLKLLSYNINGKVLQIIRNMYHNAKSCIRTNSGLTEFFSCNVGVRQGDKLLPLLFALYLNDLEEYISVEYKGLSHITDLVHKFLDSDETSTFLRLYLLLYADDTVIFAESALYLQKALDKLHDYCLLWDLSVNAEKTKVVIFSKGKIRNKPKLMLNNKELVIVSCYRYLGIEFNYNGKFTVAIKHLCDQARKAMFLLISKTRKLNLPIDIQIHLFDSTIKPILLYGCEIWGTCNTKIAETFYLKFLKNTL